MIWKSKKTNSSEASTSLPAAVAAALRPDNPIARQREDRLGRSGLVEVVARHILLSPPSESIVIAINAPWGAGKSSVLNLIEERLSSSCPSAPAATDSDHLPILIRFNPWHYTSVDQLVGMFFSELAHGIGTPPGMKATKIMKQISQALETFSGLVSVYSPAVGQAMKVGAHYFKRDMSLEKQKQAINKLLLDLGRRVVVFVDDMDRLERDSLRMLFRTIRLYADFACVTYLLAFDRLVVETNLDEPGGIRGRDYLEKIVQVSGVG